MSRLTPDVIAAAALEIGDRDGPAALTMRRIAAGLGCDPMALYRHFADREALLDAVADRALADVAVPPDDQPWDTRLTALLTDIRAAALAHPGIAAHLAGRPPLDREGRRLMLAMSSALTTAGLLPPDVVRAAQALIAYLSAAVAMAVRAGRPDARWHQVRAAMDGLAADALPVTGSDDQFRYGLRLLLAGITVEARCVGGDS